MMQRRSPVLQSPKYLKKQRRQTIGLIVLIILAVAGFITFIFLIFRLPALQISSVKIEGITHRSSEEISEKVTGGLTGSYLKIIPHSHILFFPKGKVVEIVENSFGDLEVKKISRSGLSQLSISVGEREAAALICPGFYEPNPDEEKCFMADENGFVFKKAPQFSNGVFTRFYILSDEGEVTENNILGTQVMETHKFKLLKEFVSGISKVGVTPIGVLVRDDGQDELYLKGNPETTVYFDAKIPLEKTLSNFTAFWENAKAEATSTPEFQYINLRFGKSIYYLKK